MEKVSGENRYFSKEKNHFSKCEVGSMSLALLIFSIRPLLIFSICRSEHKPVFMEMMPICQEGETVCPVTAAAL